MMKLSLGTVQFGLNYGISNSYGTTPENEAFQILDYAAAVGIVTIDTASAYGNAENIIGKYFNQHPGSRFRVISKFKDSDSFLQDSENSLASFKGYLYGYLAHTPQDVLNNDMLQNMLMSFRRENNIKIGVSVYNQIEIEKFLELEILDIIQVPLNLLDHRLIKSGILSDLKSRGVEIHARSAFLQGLIFLSDNRIEKEFPTVKPAISTIKQIALENGYSISDLALQFVNSIPEIDRFIIGVSNLQQLKENIKSLEKPYDISITEQILKEIDFNDEKVLNPALWKN